MSRIDTRPNKEFLPRSILGDFVGMECDSQLNRVYAPKTNKITVVRKIDFEINQDESLHGIFASLEGISRQLEQGEKQGTLKL